MPSVSVIVPVRNGERHLREGLVSICGQTLTDIEIIVVDDGSTDRTPELIREFAAQDPRLRVLAGPASGSAGAARNAGLAIAEGDYLAFLDSDDWFDPRLLAELHQKATIERADIAVTRFRVFDESSGRPVPVDWGLRQQFLPDQTPFAPDQLGGALFYAFGPVVWNKLFRADHIREQRLTFQELPRANDVVFTFAALAHAERITYVDQTLIDYRTGNPASLQGSLHERPLEFAAALRELKTHLSRTGRFAAVEQAFVNEALEMCLANLWKVTTPQAFLEVHRELKSSLLAEFGILGRKPGYFVRPELSANLTKLVEATAEEYLFGRLAEARAQAARARSETRTALLETALRAAASRAAGNPTIAAVPEATGEPVATSMPTPDVSVVIAVHNADRFLRQCVASVQAQTGVSLEIVCVDDGSTDRSAEILAELARDDSRITVVSEENAGPAVARNTGLDRAAGRYVCFLDSDDYWRSDSLAKLVEHADRDELDALLFDAEAVRDPGVKDEDWARFDGYYRRSGEYAGTSTGPELLARMKAAGDYRVQPCLYLMRRRFVERGHLRFLPGLSREDNLFTFEAMLTAERAAHQPTTWYARRVRPGSVMTTETRASAARGYFISCYEMLRLTAGRTYEDWVAAQIGAVIHKTYKQARNHFVRLDPEVGDRFAEIAAEPDAQALLRILKQSRREALRAQGVSAQPKVPAGPLLRARRFAGRGYRYLIRRLRRS